MSGAHRGTITSEAEFRRLWASNLSRREIGASLGISGSAVGYRAAARGFPPRADGPKPIVDDTPEFREMWAAGVLIPEIARHLGCSERAVRYAVDRFGLPRRGRYGWKSITLEQFAQVQLAQRMADGAAQDRAEAKRRAA